MFSGASRQRRLRKESRTIPVKGSGDDSGKFFRCWNCGFVCNVERDELGGRDSVGGISFEIYEERSSTIYPDGVEHGTDIDGFPLSKISVLGKGHISLKVGMDGLPQGVDKVWVPVITGGCPFCGTKNWRGDY